MKLKGHTLLKSKQSSLDTHSNVMHSSKVVVVIDNDKLLYYVNDVKNILKNRGDVFICSPVISVFVAMLHPFL